MLPVKPSNVGDRVPPLDGPVVVVCVDGFEPAYADAAIDHGCMPTFGRWRREGAFALARSVVPSFTNPNNLSIATGAPPSDHGISGNHFYDTAAAREVPMNEPHYVRVRTLFARYANAGISVGVVTAKDKLRRMLASGWRGVCFSGERADAAREDEHGIERVEAQLGMQKPGMYSGVMSDFVMACGIHLLERERVRILYLSLTDFVQHTYEPGSAEADTFFARLDRRLAQIDALGAIVIVTGDHGMNDKSAADGSPNVVFLQSVLEDVVGGAARVVLPITDPHTTHHGGLGSFATIYLTESKIGAAMERLSDEPLVDRVLTRSKAAREFQLPEDRIGDIVVLATASGVFGKTAGYHDLTGLKGKRLRSHGGQHESTVPFVVNRPLKADFVSRLERVRNWDAFEFALHGVE